MQFRLCGGHARATMALLRIPAPARGRAGARPLLQNNLPSFIKVYDGLPDKSPFAMRQLGTHVIRSSILPKLDTNVGSIGKPVAFLAKIESRHVAKHLTA